MNTKYRPIYYGVVLASILCLWLTNIFAQDQPNFFVKSKNDGLQSNIIYNTYVAQNGLLYIAHSKGLSSFDGFAFKNYYNKSFPFTELSNIMETADGTIFCKSFNNYVYRLGKDDSLISEKWFPTQIGFSQSIAYQNTLVGVLNENIAFYDTKSKTTRLIDIKSLKESSTVTDIIFSAYVKAGEVYEIAVVDKNLKCYISSAADSKLGYIQMSNGQAFWIKQKQAVEIIGPENSLEISVKAMDPTATINYVSYFDDYVWICTTNGIYYFNKNSTVASPIHILAGYNATNIVKTFDNTYIVSTIGNGLVCIPNFNILRFSNLPSRLSKIFGYQEQLFIGTQNGSTITYSLSQKKIINQSEDNAQRVTEALIYDTLSKSLISSGLNTTFRNINFLYKALFILKDYTYTLHGMLLATNSGVYYFSTNSFHDWWLKAEDTQTKLPKFLKRLTYFNEPIVDVTYDFKNDKMYFYNYRGLFELAKSDPEPTRLPDPNCVIADLKYFDNKVLLLTKDKGILQWNGTAYQQAFKDAPKAIFYNAEVFDQKLWLIAEDALYCYDKVRWKKIDNRYGIDAESINGIYVQDGHVFINDGEGIIHFPADIDSGKIAKPHLLLSNIYTNTTSKSVPPNAKLSYTDNSIIIEFNLLNFSNGGKTHLAYNINDETLIHLNNNARQIQLNHLSPGSYNVKFFIVQDNVIDAVPAQQLSFSIKTPFYKTWLFSGIILVLSIFIIAFVSRNILYRWKKEARLKQAKILLEKELDKSILSSIKAQMNPHFLFNALNTIQSYIYMNDRYNASIYISKFSDLTRSVLDASNKENITLDEEITALSLYLDMEKMRFEDSFSFEIIVDKSVNRELIRIPSMLIQPYVENAVKHGLLHKKYNRKVTVTFEVLNERLIVIINDNGIGRKRSQELNAIRDRKHQPFAMDANKKRLEILKNNFKDISFEIIDKYSPLDEPLGTKVIISLPIHIASQN